MFGWESSPPMFLEVSMQLLSSLMLFLMRIGPVTSISLTRNHDAILVSSLDSTLRLLEKDSGKLLQTFKSPKVCFMSAETLYHVLTAVVPKSKLSPSKHAIKR
jgi:hypothetical protein